MRFTYDTLCSTSRHFGHALKARGLSLPFSATQNVWAQIIAAKNFSAAAAQAKSQGYIDAIQITATSICQKLSDRSRTLDAEGAVEVFAAAIAHDLPAASPCQSRLVSILRLKVTSCLSAVISELTTGLGIIEPDRAGYVPVGKLNLVEAGSHEAAWLRANNEFVADVINVLAGRTKDQSTEFTLANIRTQNQRHNQAFANYVSQHIESICTAIAQAVLAELDPASPAQWEGRLTFEDLRQLLFDVLNAIFRNAPIAWLSADCDLGEAVMDHVAAQIRKNLWLFSEPSYLRDMPEPTEVFADAAQQAIETILDLRQQSSGQ